MRCKGKTEDGSRCKREIADDEEYCYQHRTEGEQNKENRTNSKEILKEKAAEMLANPDITTNQQVYESLDIPQSTFYDWMNKQEFIDRINKKIDKYTDRETAKVWKSLIKEAKNGDVRAIKLFFEMKGKYKQDIDLNVNQLPDINLVRGGGDE